MNTRRIDQTVEEIEIINDQIAAINNAVVQLEKMIAQETQLRESAELAQSYGCDKLADFLFNRVDELVNYIDSKAHSVDMLYCKASRTLKSAEFAAVEDFAELETAFDDLMSAFSSVERRVKEVL